MRADDETTATQLHVLLTSFMLVSASLLLYTVDKSSDGPSGGQSIVNSFELKTDGSNFSGPLVNYMRFLLMGLMVSYELMKRLFNWRAIKGIHTGKKYWQYWGHDQNIPPKCMFGRHLQIGERHLYIMICDGIMHAAFYIEVINEGLLPFIHTVFLNPIGLCKTMTLNMRPGKHRNILHRRE